MITIVPYDMYTIVLEIKNEHNVQLKSVATHSCYLSEYESCKEALKYWIENNTFKMKRVINSEPAIGFGFDKNKTLYCAINGPLELDITELIKMAKE